MTTIEFLGEDIVISEGWEDFFADITSHLRDIEKSIKNKKLHEQQTCPLKRDIFNILNYIHPEDVKVIIITPQPSNIISNKVVINDYGMGCSTYFNTTISRNIHKELFRKHKFNTPENGHLNKWIEQGVLLINFNLLLFPLEDKQFSEMWRGVITILIRYINSKVNDIILVVWHDKIVQSFFIKTFKNTIFTASDPNKKNCDLYNSDQFDLINESLIAKGKTPIDWMSQFTN